MYFKSSFPVPQTDKKFIDIIVVSLKKVIFLHSFFKKLTLRILKTKYRIIMKENLFYVIAFLLIGSSYSCCSSKNTTSKNNRLIAVKMIKTTDKLVSVSFNSDTKNVLDQEIPLEFKGNGKI